MNLLLLDVEQINQQQAIITDCRRIQHVQQHLKLKAGDCIKVGQKNGLKGTAIVKHIDAQHITLEQLQLDQPPPEKLPLTLIVALPRPKVLRRLVMDAVTLGVEQLVLIHSYRVEKSYWQTPFLQQLDSYITLGMEQAGDTIVPKVHCFKRFRPFVEDVLPGLIQGRQALVAHPYAAQPMPVGLNQPCVLVIGPEGGFIPFEVELLQQNGCQPASLGRRILRTETAAASIIGRLFT
ncbi:16S rRNA (uracil(1498)-N(3))-methyltransferase [Alkanindiges sp. WGS2144]|uniref:16S rRNA (uracil(1498)-N(3))-methyltransferase n=1 Tax=Alkanindiges sp. WGS2144 TaxID=3366808 RepID=UPI003750C631